MARRGSDPRNIFAIERMEMRWIVISPEHLYHDAIEDTDGRHEKILYRVIGHHAPYLVILRFSRLMGISTHG